MTIDPDSEHAYKLHSLRALARCSCRAHGPSDGRISNVRSCSRVVDRAAERLSVAWSRASLFPAAMCVPDLIIRNSSQSARKPNLAVLPVYALYGVFRHSAAVAPCEPPATRTPGAPR